MLLSFRKIIVTKAVSFDERIVFFQPYHEPEQEIEETRMAGPTPQPQIGVIEQASMLDLEGQEKESARRQHDSHPTIITPFPEYYLRKKGRKNLTNSHPKSMYLERNPSDELREHDTDEKQKKDISIALRKSSLACVKPLPDAISNLLNYERSLHSLKTSLISLNQIAIQNTMEEALNHPCWRRAMDEEMKALL